MKAEKEATINIEGNMYTRDSNQRQGLPQGQEKNGWRQAQK